MSILSPSVSKQGITFLSICSRPFTRIQISLSIIEMILHDYGIQSKVHSFSELQRDDDKEHNPKLKEVRLIIKVELNNGSAVVISHSH